MPRTGEDVRAGCFITTGKIQDIDSRSGWGEPLRERERWSRGSGPLSRHPAVFRTMTGLALVRWCELLGDVLPRHGRRSVSVFRVRGRRRSAGVRSGVDGKAHWGCRSGAARGRVAAAVPHPPGAGLPLRGERLGRLAPDRTHGAAPGGSRAGHDAPARCGTEVTAPPGRPAGRDASAGRAHRHLRRVRPMAADEDARPCERSPHGTCPCARERQWYPSGRIRIVESPPRTFPGARLRLRASSRRGRFLTASRRPRAVVLKMPRRERARWHPPRWGRRSGHLRRGSPARARYSPCRHAQWW